MMDTMAWDRTVLRAELYVPQGQVGEQSGGLLLRGAMSWEEWGSLGVSYLCRGWAGQKGAMEAPVVTGALQGQAGAA